MKVYISGPMSGIKNENRLAFNATESFLKSHLKDVVVLNPAILPAGLTQGEYMDICMSMVRACDLIFMIDGWEASKGAVSELAYAEKLEKRVLLQDREEMKRPSGIILDVAGRRAGDNHG